MGRERQALAALYGPIGEWRDKARSSFCRVAIVPQQLFQIEKLPFGLVCGFFSTVLAQRVVVVIDEFKNKRLVILCNDCEKKSDIKFSFEFLKCSHCGGYNTSEVDTYDSINSSENPSVSDIVID